MKLKHLRTTRLAVALILISGIFLAGCRKTLEETDVMYAGPMLDTILEGIRAGNYDQFTRDFSEKMKDSLQESDFTALVTELHEKLGDYEGRSFISAVWAENPVMDLMVVKYRARYSNDSNVTITIYFSDNSGTRLIEGFLMESPTLDR
jgi:hypothetical protein